MGQSRGLDALEKKKKIPYVCRESNQDSLVVQLIYYTDYDFFLGGGEYFTASCIPSGSVSVFVEYNASLLYPQADSNARKFQKGITHGEQKKTIHLLKIPNRCLPEELHSCYVFTTDRP